MAVESPNLAQEIKTGLTPLRLIPGPNRLWYVGLERKLLDSFAKTGETFAIPCEVIPILRPLAGGARLREISGELNLPADEVAASFEHFLEALGVGALTLELRPTVKSAAQKLVDIGIEMFPAKSLTMAEVDVLRLAALGLSDEEIAYKLVKSHYTVRMQLSAILNKFCVGNRTEAVIKGIELGIFSLEWIVKEAKIDPEKVQSLTQRRKSILELVASGAYNKEIARWLGISEVTVKNCLQRIFDKLEVKNRTQAAVAFLAAEKDGSTAHPFHGRLRELGADADW